MTSPLPSPEAFHSLADRRSWALHVEVARRLKSDESVLTRARQRVQGWLDSPGAHPYAEGWAQLLAADLDHLTAALENPEPHMCTLRQASPFAGALDQTTRWRILKSPELRGRAAS